MNAVMRRYELTEGTDMPESEDNNLAIQVAELRSDVRHIQSDVTDLKTGVRALEQEISAVKNSLWSAKVWALLLYFALAGSLLLVLARGFKWL